MHAFSQHMQPMTAATAPADAADAELTGRLLAASSCTASIPRLSLLLLLVTQGRTAPLLLQMVYLSLPLPLVSFSCCTAERT
jgi:hypothetical protein